MHFIGAHGEYSGRQQFVLYQNYLPSGTYRGYASSAMRIPKSGISGSSHLIYMRNITIEETIL